MGLRSHSTGSIGKADPRWNSSRLLDATRFVDGKPCPTWSVQPTKMDTAVVVAKDVGVRFPNLGHPDRADLAHAHAVSEASTAEHERRRASAWSLGLDGEQSRLEAAQQATDVEVALGDRAAAITDDP